MGTEPNEVSMELDLLRREVQQYVMLKDQIDTLGERRDNIKKGLMSAVEADGLPNEKGSIVLEINDETTGTKSVVKQRRVSKVLDEKKAEKLLNDKNLFDACTKTITVLDPDVIMSKYYDGELTDEDIDTMFPEKVVWALVLEK